MDSNTDDIHPIFDKMLDRASRERLLKQRGTVIWLYGLSGSGKSTLANALEQLLHTKGFLTQILDGDNIRTGLNKNVGFSDEDRLENIRRIAEVAKLYLNTGVVTIASFITPKKSLRQLAREIVGESDFLEVYVSCSYETCEQRDVKGLYAKANAGNLKQFTGRDSSFEPPSDDRPADLVIDTENSNAETSAERLYQVVAPRIQLNQTLTA